jgi:predicted N-formylglutamate amidohydrolase
MPYLVGQDKSRAIFGKRHATINNLTAVTIEIIGDSSNEEEGSASLRNTLASSLTVRFTSI